MSNTSNYADSHSIGSSQPLSLRGALARRGNPGLANYWIATGSTNLLGDGAELPTPNKSNNYRTAVQLPAPDTQSNKYNRGVVGIISGSMAFPGAGVLTCRSAIKSGASLVFWRSYGGYISTVGVIGAAPEVVPLHSLSSKFNKLHALLVGPGVTEFAITLQRRQVRKFIRKHAEKPLILDAGGFNIVPYLVKKCGRLPQNVILTPHSGELVNLQKTFKVADFAELHRKVGGTFLLKGNPTRIINDSGEIIVPDLNPYLSTAGSGDVLAGILVAYFAQMYAKLKVALDSAQKFGKLVLDITAHCVQLHSAASEKHGHKQISASDIIDNFLM